MFCCDDFLSLGCYGHCGCVKFLPEIIAPYDGDYMFHYAYAGSPVIRLVPLFDVTAGDPLYLPKELNENQTIFLRIELPQSAPERWLRIAPYECFKLKSVLAAELCPSGCYEHTPLNPCPECPECPEDMPPIYLKYEPASQLRSGTGTGYDSPNMYWNEPAIVLHAFGPEYTRLQVFFAMAMQGDINSQWELYCRDFDTTSTHQQNTAAQAPVPGSVLALNGPHPAGGTLFFPSTPEFDCVPGRAFNFGARRLSGPNASIRMIAATYKFSAP